MSVKKKRYGLIVVLALATLLAPLASACQRSPGASDALESPLGVPPGRDVPTPAEQVSLTASGTIQVRGIRIASELGGRILDLRVRDGAEVRPGEILATLDATPLLLQLSQAEAAVATARADLELARAGPRVEEIAALQAALSLAQAQRDGARATWANALDAIENPQELDAQVSQAYAQVELAEHSYTAHVLVRAICPKLQFLST